MDIKIGRSVYAYDESDPVYDNGSGTLFAATDKKGKKYFLLLAKEGCFEGMVDLKKNLKKIGVDSPKLKKADKNTNAILLKYFEGERVDKLLFESPLSDGIFEEAFRLARFARLSKYTLDFAPENFLYGKKGMVYVGTGLYPLKEERRFERNDIRLWIYTSEGVAHLKSLGYDVTGIVPYNETEGNRQVVLTVVKNYQ